MLKTEYLYGIAPETLDDILYFDALKFKLEFGKILYGKLLKLSEQTEYEHIREFHVGKALKHTQKLLDERTEIE